MSSEWEERLDKGLCPVCGEGNKRQFRCCSKACTSKFWKKAIWSFELRPKVFLRDKYICQKCGFNGGLYSEWKTRFHKWQFENGDKHGWIPGADKIYEDETGDKAPETKRLDNDHIIAIALGGDEYDMKNMQTLCEECHKAKTKIDIRDIALKRKNQTKLGAW